jgi:hypothetical protein
MNAIEYELIIKKYFENCNMATIQTRSPKFLKENPVITQYLTEYLNKYPNWETIKHILYKIVLDIKLPKCLGCGKELKFSQRKKKYCSLKCCNSSEFFLKHKEECILKKYGVKNIQQLKNVKEKIKKTVENKLNVDSNYWKKRQEKTINTKIKKYGSVENANKIKKEKYKKTCLEKYGVRHIFQIDEFKNKSQKTIIKKYGSLENYYKHLKETNNHNFYNIENAWNKIITKWKDYIIPLFSRNDYYGGNKIYKWKCVKCGNTFESKIYSTGHLDKVDRYLPRCLNCYPKHIRSFKKRKRIIKILSTIFSKFT